MIAVRRMAGALAAVVTLSLLGVACGDDGAETTTTTTTLAAGAPTPAEAVRSWIAAVATGRYADATALVVADQVELAIGIENGLGHQDIAAMLRHGVADATYRSFWVGFAESFVEASGKGFSALDVGAVATFDIGSRQYAAVEVFFPDRIGSTEIIALRVPGGWQVDLIAVIGPSLVRPMRALVIGLPTDADGTSVIDAMRAVAPSLRAALSRPEADDLPVEFRAELVSLIQFLEG